MPFHWRTELLQLAILAAMFVVAGVAWPFAPERIPIHWDHHGEVDRYGGKFEALIATPLLALVLYGVLLLLPRIDPGRANYAAFEKTYSAIRILAVSAAAYVYSLILLAVFGRAINMTTSVTLGVGFVLVILGNYMGKIRPNWFVGVKTPWTLSSRQSWNKTHRLARWLFIAMGLTVVTYGFVSSGWMLAVLFGVMGVSIASLFIFSYVVWRGDAQRSMPANTSPPHN